MLRGSSIRRHLFRSIYSESGRQLAAQVAQCMSQDLAMLGESQYHEIWTSFRNSKRPRWASSPEVAFCSIGIGIVRWSHFLPFSSGYNSWIYSNYYYLLMKIVFNFVVQSDSGQCPMDTVFGMFLVRFMSSLFQLWSVLECLWESVERPSNTLSMSKSVRIERVWGPQLLNFSEPSPLASCQWTACRCSSVCD